MLLKTRNLTVRLRALRLAVSASLGAPQAADAPGPASRDGPSYYDDDASTTGGAPAARALTGSHWHQSTCSESANFVA